MRKFNYTCSPSMKPFIEQVLKGEYDIHTPGNFKFAKRLDILRALDIGANIGAFTFWLTQTYPNITVDAYEPNLLNANAYLKNLDESAIPAWKYRLHNVAVTSADVPTLTMYEGVHNCGMHSFNANLAGQTANTFEVATMHPAKLPQVDFLKADTEGCEVDIISHYLATHEAPSLLSYEYHSIPDRLALEDLVRKDYILCSGTIFAANLGVCNFIARRHVA